MESQKKSKSFSLSENNIDMLEKFAKLKRWKNSTALDYIIEMYFKHNLNRYKTDRMTKIVD